MAKFRKCVCGRVRCDSINRERHVVRSKPSKYVTSNETGVVSIENGDAWWVDEGGTRLCADEPENNSVLVNILVNSLGKVRRTLNAHIRHRRGEFLVTRRSYATLFLTGHITFAEYCTLSFKPDYSINFEHCEVGGEPSQR